MRRAVGVSLVVAGGILASAGAVLWTAPDWLIDSLARRYPGCLYRVPTENALVALTIDDGPDPVSTPRILAELGRHDATATFFLITERVGGRETLVERLIKEGHELGNHFTRDRASIRLTREAFEADLLGAHRVLSKWERPRWARPGSGWYSREMIEVMRRHGYRCALGSVYPFDAAVPSVAWARRYILRNVRPGAVVVLHDGGNRGLRTARILAAVLPELRRKGYRVVSLGRLVDGVGSQESGVGSRESGEGVASRAASGGSITATIPTPRRPSVQLGAPAHAMKGLPNQRLQRAGATPMIVNRPTLWGRCWRRPRS
jgi:peptidoglycan-N-acetylglucosamine deacetylase